MTQKGRVTPHDAGSPRVAPSRRDPAGGTGGASVGSSGGPSSNTTDTQSATTTTGGPANHTHGVGVTVTSTGGNDNRPAFLQVQYIIKL